MKLDLLNGQWLDIVFEGRNKSYGAYEMRKKNQSTSALAFVIGAVVFALAVATPKIAEFIGNSTSDDSATLNTKITTVKMPPKEKPKENLPPPPPPPPKVDQVKFVKPVVAKTEEVVEEIVQIKKIEDKKLGAETIKGDPDADLRLEPPGDGPKQAEVVEETNEIYNSAGVEVKPDFPGGIAKFYNFIKNNYQAPDEPGLKGQVFVSFVVEKDGTLTDVKVLRDVGFGTGKEAERVLRKSPRWTPAEQNGKKVRCSYQIPIKIETPEE
jgi:protein TonB